LKNAYVGKVGDSPLNSENDPLRGQKNTLYEGGIRVCAFVNWPGKLTPGKCAAPLHAVDWFPTLASVAGYRPDKDLKWDGIDHWDVLRGKAQPPASRTIYIAMRNGHALRHGDWKLIIRGKNAPELFNLAKDPYEKNDLAKEQADKVAELKKLLEAQQALDNPKLPDDLRNEPE